LGDRQATSESKKSEWGLIYCTVQIQPVLPPKNKPNANAMIYVVSCCVFLYK